MLSSNIALKHFFKSFLALLMRLWSHLYTYRFSQWLVGKRNMLYTLWIKNFLGEVGEKCFFHTRQYICVDEVPRLIDISFNKHLPSGIYNIQGKDTLTVKEIVKLIHQKKGKIVQEGCFGTVQRTDIGMKFLALDGTKLNNIIGFSSSVSIEEVLENYS